MVTTEIRSIAERLEQSVNPQKIYLFGSRSLRGLKRRSVDIVVGSVSSFDERKDRKTLDLGLRMEQLSDFVTISEDVLNAADKLTSYGVKLRYPQ